MSAAYDQLCALSSEMAILEALSATSGWDQETYMPEQAIAHRAKQLSYLSGKSHEIFTSKEFRTALDKAEGELDALPDAYARANMIWKKMLAAYEQPAIDPSIDDALKDYMVRRKRELAGKPH